MLNELDTINQLLLLNVRSQLKKILIITYIFLEDKILAFSVLSI